ncbi:LysR family transcriptional regulator [Microbacterium phosphatis]|uniref:LysR family transcriptional regulator n=1 Tax=Microbacterium phosphatis TaxID=3140248 RepID=UPI0031405D36
MELRQLRYFAAAVEAGSLTAAATRLHLSQPSLSAAIQRLETELGVPLLVRTPRGIEPTSAGRYLLTTSSRILGDLDDVAAAFRRFGSGTSGSLTLAAVPVLMWRRIPRLLSEHAADAPDVEIRLIDPPPWTAIDLLQDRKADLAAINVADAEDFVRRHHDAFEIVDWGEIPLVAALPPSCRDAPDPLPLRAFDGRTVVLPQRTTAVPSLPEAIEQAFRTHDIAPATMRITETIQTSVPLIEAGLAWGILPDPDFESLTRFELVVRRLYPAPAPLSALVLTRQGAAADPALARLLRRISGADGP